MKVRKVTWKEYQNLVEKLALKIKRSEIEFDSIYGIPRGGLVLATILSHILNKRLTLTPNTLEDILVVDDIADTGKTLRNLLDWQRLREGCSFGEPLKMKWATLFYKPRAEMKNKLQFVEEVPNDVWVKFPYEYDVPKNLNERDKTRIL